MEENSTQKKRKTKASLPVLLGLGIWLLFAFRWLPFSPFDLTYVHILLLAAPLFLVPLVWELRRLSNIIKTFSLPAALLLAISFLLQPGYLPAILAIPWLALCSFLAVDQFVKFTISANRTIAGYCHLMAFIYLPVGAAWAFADRLAFSPFGFDPAITLLTAVHFHYAGFLLPIMTGFILKEKGPSLLSSLIGWGVILGTPLVALGITTTQFQYPAFIEVFAVTIMASAGAATGLLHVLLGFKNRSKVFGLLWIIAGLALLSGMTLALLYGWRHYYPIPAITIPWMYAFHGTMNAVGFAVPGIVGWWFYKAE